RPANLRFEVNAPLQGTVATLVAGGQDFSLLDTRNNKFLVGPAKGCNVARLIGIELAPGDVVATLLGGVPEFDLMTPTKLDWDPDAGGRERLSLQAPNGAFVSLFLDARNQHWDVLAAERRDRDHRVEWRIDNEGWQDDSGVRRPAKMHITQPTIGVEIWI